jgi:hypothetical protein
VDQVATPQKKFTLWKINFPELDHLPAAEREILMRAALQSVEVQTFRQGVGKYFMLLSFLISATLFTLVVLNKAVAVKVWLIFAASAWLILILALLLKIKLELRVLRGVLKGMLKTV